MNWGVSPGACLSVSPEKEEQGEGSLPPPPILKLDSCYLVVADAVDGAESAETFGYPAAGAAYVCV